MTSRGAKCLAALKIPAPAAGSPCLTASVPLNRRKDNVRSPSPFNQRELDFLFSTKTKELIPHSSPARVLQTKEHRKDDTPERELNPPCSPIEVLRNNELCEVDTPERELRDVTPTFNDGGELSPLPPDSFLDEISFDFGDDDVLPAVGDTTPPFVITVPAEDDMPRTPLLPPNNSNEEQAKKRSRKDTVSDYKGRKKPRREKEWKANVSKRKLNLGEAYTTSRGKEKEARRMGDVCNCRFNCASKITETERFAAFQQYWKLGDHTRQWDYINMNVEEGEPENRTTFWHSPRNISRKYFLPVNGQKVRVCQALFISTLGICETVIRTAMHKKNSTLSPDKRGKHSHKFTKIKGPIFNSVVEHINMFEKKEAHYCRKDSNREYLDENLSIRKMYMFYGEFMAERQQKENEEADDDNRPRTVLPVATERQYRDIFNSEFKLAFFIPRKDRCDQCVAWEEATVDEKKAMEDRRDQHIRNKEASRRLKDADKVETKSNPGLCLASFDLQKVLTAPHGDTSSFYYVSKLATYNFTVFDIGRVQGYCYCWHEETAKRGSNEIGSFLTDFVERKVREKVTEFRFYSDNCAGQNKNRIIYAVWHYLAVKHQVKITHRFLEVGHTQTEGDSMHATIERAAKNKTIYTPQEWFTLIKVVSKKPYIVKEIVQDDIFNLKELIQGQNWSKDSSGNKVPWNNVREIQVNGKSPGEVNLRCDYSSEYRTLKLWPQAGRRPNIANFHFNKAYSGRLPVTKKKKDGLISLCVKRLIPTDRQHIFYQLSTDASQQQIPSDEEDNI